MKVIQGIVCVLLGTTLNINKEDDHEKAAKANNVTLCLNILIVVVNLIINVFEMKDPNEYGNPTTSSPATKLLTQSL